MEPILNEILNSYQTFNLERFHYPRQDEWVLAWGAMQFIGRLVETVRPMRVIELGSGRSTEVISTEAVKYGGAVLSFEHRARFARDSQSFIDAAGLAKTAQVVHRRLTLRRYGTKLLPTYSFQWKRYGPYVPFDFAFIDGPPGYIGREATLYELFPRLALNAWIVADDMNRPGEQRWLGAWMDAYGDALEAEMFPKIGEGIALLRKRADRLPHYPTLRARLSGRHSKRRVPTGDRS